MRESDISFNQYIKHITAAWGEKRYHPQRSFCISITLDRINYLGSLQHMLIRVMQHIRIRLSLQRMLVWSLANGWPEQYYVADKFPKSRMLT